MVLYTDGGCEGNDQRDMAKRRMIMVVVDEAGKVLSDRICAGGSNNIAELRAVRDALVWCQDKQIDVVEIRTDSRNNLAWVCGVKVGKAINDRAQVLSLRDEIRALRQKVTYALVWIPREQNKAGQYLEGVYGC